MYLNSPYTYVEERKIINYALQGSRLDFKFLRAGQGSGAKSVNYKIISKAYGNKAKIVKIRNRMNEYLEKHPEYFLNNGYYIALTWVGTHSGGPPLVAFTNNYRFHHGDINIHKKSTSLDFLYVSDMFVNFQFRDIPDYTKYADVKGLSFDEDVTIDNTEVLQNFKSLEYFEPNDRISDEDLEKLKLMLPDCEIYR